MLALFANELLKLTGSATATKDVFPSDYLFNKNDDLHYCHHHEHLPSDSANSALLSRGYQL